MTPHPPSTAVRATTGKARDALVALFGKAVRWSDTHWQLPAPPTVTVDGETRLAREVFLVERDIWIMFTRPNGDRGYATASEWAEWKQQAQGGAAA